MQKNKINWGIIGLGNIAHKFAEGLKAVPDAVLYAVASREESKALDFKNKYNACSHYGSYTSLINDPLVDILYIATPHPQHYHIAKEALNNKKAVLCEKPLTINHKEALELVTLAQKNNTFFMEAMWTHCFPIIIQLKQLLHENAIGEIKSLHAHFCCKLKTVDPKSRAFNLELGGGALLDLGVYPIAIAQLLLGKPDKIESSVKMNTTGVDEDNEITCTYKNNTVAYLSSSFCQKKENSLLIIGTKGQIKIEDPFWQPTKMSYESQGENGHVDKPMLANGYEYEAMEAMHCLRNNQIESQLVKHQNSLDVMTTMDTLRSQWGLRYPNET